MKKIIALGLALVMGLCFSTSSSAYAKEDGAKKLGIVPVTMDSTHDRTMTIASDGALWVWGSFSHPYLDNQSKVCYDMYQEKPRKVLEDVVSVSCGRCHAAAIKEDGTLWTWGLNDCGQLGRKVSDIGGFDNDLVPTR